jgi:cytochrome bd-type quinol oxidase subunit 2
VDLPLGALCEACRREIHTRARRIARWVSLVTTAAFGAYAMAVLPVTQSARLVGAAATLVWFVVIRRVTVQVVRLWLEEKRDERDTRDTRDKG